MQMRDRFPAIAAIVDDQAIAILLQTRFFCNFGCLEKQMAQDLMVVRLCFAHSRNALFGNDQNVNRRLGSAIAKSENKVIFVNDVRRNFPGNDLFEDIAHTTTNAHDRLARSVSQQLRK